jgi:hypothetical protein
VIVAVGRLLARIVLEVAVTLLALALALLLLAGMLAVRSGRRVVTAQPDPWEQFSQAVLMLIGVYVKLRRTYLQAGKEMHTDAETASGEKTASSGRVAS